MFGLLGTPFPQTLFLRCCRLLTTSANEYCNITETSIFNRKCSYKKKRGPHITDFTDKLEKKIISVCRAGTVCASSLFWPISVSHLTLTSPGSGNGNLCSELWQYKWIPGETFCQYLAGASSCSTAAVKHMSALSLHSPPGTGWIGICGLVLVFFFAPRSFSSSPSEHSSVKHEIAWPWSSSLDWWDP